MVITVLGAHKFEMSPVAVKPDGLTGFRGWVRRKQKPGACSTRLEIRFQRL